MEEKIRILEIRKKLERLAEHSREHFQWEIEHNKKRRLLRYFAEMEEDPKEIHDFYVNGLNDAYKKICEEFDLKYSPIKSEIKTN